MKVLVQALTESSEGSVSWGRLCLASAACTIPVIIATVKSNRTRSADE